MTTALLLQLVNSTGYGALDAALTAQGIALNGWTPGKLAASVEAAAPQLHAEQFVLAENGERYTYTTLTTLAGDVISRYEQVGDAYQMEAVSATYLAEARTAAKL